MRRYVSFLKAGIVIVCFLGLIYWNDKVMMGITEGVQLCIEGVIPSLFPFLILSSLTVGVLRERNSLFLRKIGHILGLPQGAEGVYIVGLLGGYPMGAKIIAEMSNAGNLQRKDAERMLLFCSNCGPAFILGMAFPLFGDFRYVLFLWIQHILSSFIMGIMIPKEITHTCRLLTNHASNVMEQATKTIGTICGWVTIFRAGIYLINSTGLFTEGKISLVLLGGIMELTNGILMLKDIELLHDRLLLASIFINFGGICVLMQTFSVIGNLRILPYAVGKISQMGIGLVITELFYILLSWSIPRSAILIIFCGAGIAFLGVQISKKIVLEIQKPIMYNKAKKKEEYHAVS